MSTASPVEVDGLVCKQPGCVASVYDSRDGLDQPAPVTAEEPTAVPEPTSTNHALPAKPPQGIPSAKAIEAEKEIAEARRIRGREQVQCQVDRLIQHVCHHLDRMVECPWCGVVEE